MTTTDAATLAKLDAVSLFFRRNDPAYAHSASALIGGGIGLHVYGSKHSDKVEFTRTSHSLYLALDLTSKDARAVAGELIAAADAVDAALAQEMRGKA